jgi:hypothetical protein
MDRQLHSNHFSVTDLAALSTSWAGALTAKAALCAVLACRRFRIHNRVRFGFIGRYCSTADESPQSFGTGISIDELIKQTSARLQPVS